MFLITIASTHYVQALTRLSLTDTSWDLRFFYSSSATLPLPCLARVLIIPILDQNLSYTPKREEL